MELLSVWLSAAFAIAAVVLVFRSGGSIAAKVVLVSAMIALCVALLPPRAHAHEPSGPRVVRDEFIGSGACRACHPGEHASWSRTYHRTMTQRGTGSVALTTGSHHIIGYWTEDDRGDLHMLPEVYARDEGRRIPRHDAFLQPPDAPDHDVRWRTNCIVCHTTAGRPDEDGRASHVAELGIACEACHGPGREHANGARNPLARWRRRGEHITNPTRLTPERASAVCGSCHAYSFPRDEAAFLSGGYSSFRPGDNLGATRIMLTPTVLANGTVSLDTDTRNLFWPDGTVRVGGREYNAMILSACYLRGVGDRTLTCMSCHSMHESDPDDQLRKDRTVDAACLSCHAVANDHTRHQSLSCVSCHMPKTSYALRTGIRSHRIESPDRTEGKPNACVLCHIDKSADWSRAEMARLWGRGAAVPDGVKLPASIVGMLSADAAERVIWADAYAEREAIDASGADWEHAVLDVARRNPYAVIRFIAERSARSHPVSSRNLVAPEVLDELVKRRDNRPVSIAE